MLISPSDHDARTVEARARGGQIRHVDGDQAPAKLLLEDGTPYEFPGTLQFSE